MTSLLVAKQYIKNFVSRYEIYLKPVGKLILALITLMTINGKIGFMQKIDNISVVLIAALMCSFMPTNFIIVVAALFVLLHLYALSMCCNRSGIVSGAVPVIFPLFPKGYAGSDSDADLYSNGNSLCGSAYHGTCGNTGFCGIRSLWCDCEQLY